jgi:16S rRNA (cytosine967-C5)-methyltransferase
LADVEPDQASARTVALDVLVEVRRRGAYANLLLPARTRRAGLPERDRAFATDLVYGTLRWQGLLDAVLAAASGERRIEDDVRDVLRLGAYQVLLTRVAPHAAVSTSVDLTRRQGKARAAGFVNAVLRTVAKRSVGSWVQQVAPERSQDLIGHLCVATSHPRWAVEALAAVLPDASRLEAVLRTDNTPAPVTLVSRPPHSSAAELLAAGAVPGRYSPWAARWLAGDPGRVPAVREGRAGIQDEGSQLVALALARAGVHGSPAGAERWLDLCAGPGGKTALLAALAHQAPGTSGRPSRLTAIEPVAARARLVRRATAAEDHCAVVRADGTVPPLPPGAFDRVLVDAPCTGLGAVRRRPDSRWRRTARDLASLVDLQQRLLRSALELVRPGGVVGYATCSPHLDETTGVVRSVLSSRPDVEELDAPALLPEVPSAARGRYVQLWPDLHDTDAMFVAVLRTGSDRR